MSTINIDVTKNVYDVDLQQNVTSYDVTLEKGYYPLPGGGGGGGGGDTSNLVPYIGANKDVNIASNYFKTSKGFDFTKDIYNYFRAFNNGGYNTFEFYSKDDNGGFGNILCVINPVEGFGVYQSNGYEITNYFNITQYETYSSKPFVSNVGFVKTGGTANQALTADGGVFDLNTKADLIGGKIPASQLPAYVDDVLEFANLASFPATGESGKIYIAIDTNLTYRWGGSSYVVMSSSLALGETSSTAYRGDRGKVAYDHSQATGNPHGTTKNDIGLGNVDNTSDLYKPISTATQNALDNKQNAIGYTPENVANKATDLSSPDNTKYPTTLAVANENKKATITVELISQLTTNFYAPNALRINSTTLISGSGTLTLKVNDVAYTLGNLIPQGAKITAETSSSSVYNLISIYE